jgi:hypothetical protein
MSLVRLIDDLINEIGTGINEATIRSRLLTMKEQAEALDSALKENEAALKECNSALHDACADLERFKSDTEAEKLIPDQKTVEELLRLMAVSGQAFLEEMASELRLHKTVVQHHVNKLDKMGLVEPVAYHLGRGMLYVLTEKGTAYVVEKKLV